MKGYYIHFDGSKTPGVNKKIKMQVKEFQKYFDLEELEISFIPKSLLWRIFRLLPFGGIERDYKSCLKKMKAPDFVYIRRTLADKYYIQFLKEIKRKYPKCKILIEIFTYPYDKDEFSSWFAFPLYWKEKWNRKKIPTLIDRYVTVSEDDYILGKETLKISNGIFVDQVKLPMYNKKEDGRIDMLAVAVMQSHHGYERIIEGMHAYYQNGGERQVYLHLVGNGPEKNFYQELVKQYGLDEKVLFYSELLGVELENVYNNKDIAVSSLGCYKKNINYLSALKTREYLAAGLPMVTGCKIDVFEKKNCNFYCAFPNDESLIDINRIISFCDEINRNGKEEVQKKIKQYAKETVDMDIAMAPVIRYLRVSSESRAEND